MTNYDDMSREGLIALLRHRDAELGRKDVELARMHSALDVLQEMVQEARTYTRDIIRQLRGGRI